MTPSEQHAHHLRLGIASRPDCPVCAAAAAEVAAETEQEAERIEAEKEAKREAVAQAKEARRKASGRGRPARRKRVKIDSNGVDAWGGGE